MSVGPTRGPVQLPSDGRDFTEIFQRLEDLERYPPGRWIYVGDYPADPGTTPDSPPFQNGWSNVGGGQQRLRFRLTNENQTEFEGVITGGTDGSVVTTVAPLYAPPEEILAPGVGGYWTFQPDGDLLFQSVTTGGPGSDTTAIHWGVNTDADADGLIIAAAQSVFIDSGTFPFEIDTQGGNATINTGSGTLAFDVGGGDWSAEMQNGTFEVASAFQVHAADDGQIYLYTDGPYFLLDNSGQVATLYSSDSVTIDAAGDMSLTAGDDLAVTSSADISIEAQGTTEIKLPLGQSLVVKDHLGNPILQMTEGSPDLHIPTGGSVVADL